MTTAYRCPYCGSPSTPFAAGCAYWGADLDGPRPGRGTVVVHRFLHRLRSHRAARPTVPGPRSRR
jgi:hypothetical protein